MEIGIGLIAGIAIGAILAFLLVGYFVKRSASSRIKEINKKSDLEIQEARLTAKRMIDEAETKAEKIVKS